MKKFDSHKYKSVTCIGGGLTSLTFARLFVEKFNVPVRIIETREHLGGNSYSYIDHHTGIDIHKYGSHIFHTNNVRIWNFINRFSEFEPYSHKVFVNSNNQIFSFPINLMTLSQFFGKSISPSDAKKYFDSIASSNQASNFEEKAISSIGHELYSRFFKGYTKKQWGVDPIHLPEEIFNRIPIRLNYENTYFSDRFQGVPKGSYGELAENIAGHPLIEVDLNQKWTRQYLSEDTFYIYTGPIDELFSYEYGRLSWRGVRFEFEILNVADYQGNSVINYPDVDIPYTRIHEFKHFKPRIKSESTVIAREYPVLPDLNFAEPAYPVRSGNDLELLSKYNTDIEKIPNLIAAGRLGTYKYLDMHMAIGAALTTFDALVGED